ncbi:MAG TPA: ComEC/Rec2 family competence protein [Caulobacteraceae bacterium]|nr:ComEC/Rec2 family competence protein [Caulobacteraceae bacterium]
MLWTPVAFGIGAALYLGLKREPPLWSLLLAAAAAVAVAIGVRGLIRRRWLSALAALVAVCACGALDGKLRSDQVAAPIVPAGIGVVTVDGWVMDVANPSDSGERVVVAPVRISGLAPERLPFRVRIVVPAGSVLGPGAAIRVQTLLDPPPGPAAPGAFDFARDAWFEGLGGVGLAMKPPEAISLADPPWRLQLAMAVNAMRWSLAERLAADLHRLMGASDGGATGLAVTVATSHEDWLPANARDDLRASGLAHMLAIAGLHMAAVAGFAFFALRFGVAAWPWLALRVSSKKVAAAGGLIVVMAYLTLSGAHPPARRAAITAAVAFLAILFDRRAISLHSLSLAALLILVLQPEAVAEPGFQMSFCATAALVALAEMWPVRTPAVGLPWPLAFLQTARDWIVAALMVSFVAGTATGPFAIQHFNRVANYGVPANLTADLVASVVMMPALALGVAAEALGLGHAFTDPPLFVAGWGARAITALADVFAHAPSSGLALPSAPVAALVIAYLGIVFACLWRGRLRWLGLPFAAAVALWPRPPAPVAWVASDGDDAAIVVNGQEIAMKPAIRAYATQLWAQRRGFALPADPAAAQAALFDCDRASCTPKSGTSPAIAAWWTRRKPKPDQLDALCADARVLVIRADVPLPESCARLLVLGPDDFARGGAAELYAAPGGYRLLWSQPFRGERPWSRFSGSDG